MAELNLYDIPGAYRRGEDRGKQNLLAQLVGETYNAPPEKRNALLGEMARTGPQGMNAANVLSQQWKQEKLTEQSQLEQIRAMTNKKIGAYAYEAANALEQGVPLAEIIQRGQQSGIPMEEFPREDSPATRMMLRTVARAHGFGDSPGSTPAQLQTFNALTQGMSPEDVDAARRQQLNLDPRPPSASPSITMIGGVPHVFNPRNQTMEPVSVGGQQVTAESVASSEAIIGEGKKFGELTGASRAQAIDKGIETVQAIDANIRNLDQAIQALADGAQSGPIISRFTPTIREATQRLDQIQGALALDVVGATTFGALSEGELDLAKQVAMPNLPPAELTVWLQNKQAAQRKLAAYYQEQIDFLDQGGTVAGFLRMKRREQESQNQGGGDILSQADAILGGQ